MKINTHCPVTHLDMDYLWIMIWHIYTLSDVSFVCFLSPVILRKFFAEYRVMRGLIANRFLRSICPTPKWQFILRATVFQNFCKNLDPWSLLLEESCDVYCHLNNLFQRFVTKQIHCTVFDLTLCLGWTRTYGYIV